MGNGDSEDQIPHLEYKRWSLKLLQICVKSYIVVRKLGLVTIFTDAPIFWESEYRGLRLVKVDGA